MAVTVPTSYAEASALAAPPRRAVPSSVPRISVASPASPALPAARGTAGAAGQRTARDRSHKAAATQAAFEALQATLRPLYDQACVLALAVARGDVSEAAAWAMLHLSPASRAVLDPLCTAGCTAAHAVQPRPPNGWRRSCRCSAAFYLRSTWARELDAWDRALPALDQAIRKRLAPVLARSGTQAEIAAACRDADPAGILTSAERRAIALEEIAWWTRLHARLPEERRDAA